MPLVVTSCGDFGKELSIRSKRGDYEGWIAANRPHLLSVPKASVYRTEFTTMDYGKGDISPIFDYHYKAGDRDGILDVTIVFSIDAAGAIKGIREERFTFVALPATAAYPSPSDGGRLRHAYHGLDLPAADVTATLARVTKGDDFDAERERSHRGGKIVMSCFVDTDDLRPLRAGVAPEPQPPKVDESKGGRTLIPPP